MFKNIYTTAWSARVQTAKNISFNIHNINFGILLYLDKTQGLFAKAFDPFTQAIVIKIIKFPILVLIEIADCLRQLGSVLD